MSQLIFRAGRAVVPKGFEQGPRADLNGKNGKNGNDGGTEPELPAAGKMAMNLMRSIGRNAVHVARGGNLIASAAKQEMRAAVCRNGCPFFRASDVRCAHPDCGCFLRSMLMDKWRLEAEKCPDKRWD